MKLVLKLNPSQALALRKAWENSDPAKRWNASMSGTAINKFAKHLLWAASNAVATLPESHRNWPYAFDARDEAPEETAVRCMEPASWARIT